MDSLKAEDDDNISDEEVRDAITAATALPHTFRRDVCFGCDEVSDSCDWRGGPGSSSPASSGDFTDDQMMK